MKIRNDDSEADYAAIGKIILLWGHVEASLAAMIVTLTFPPFGLEKHNGVPQPFSKKCELALRGFDTIEAMLPIRGAARVAIESLRPLHDIRSVMVHGYFQGLSINGYIFTIYNSRTKSWQFKTFSEPQIGALAQRIFDVGSLLEHIARDAETLRSRWHTAYLKSRGIDL